MVGGHVLVHHASCGSCHVCSLPGGRSTLSLVVAGLEQLLHHKFTPSLLPIADFQYRQLEEKENQRHVIFMFLSQFRGCFRT